MRPSPPAGRPGRRRVRWALGAALGAVLFLRFAVFPPDPEFPLVPSWEVLHPRAPEPRHRYRPTELAPPQSAVPADLPRIRLEFGAQATETLRGYFWHRPRGAEERPEVEAIVREGGAVYERVSVHLKGAAGSFRPFDDKPALTLNFARHVPGRRFHGFTKISLNNSVQDPTFLCEALVREMFEAAGIPAARADFVTVLINGVDKGPYVLTEGYNKDFVRRHFPQVRGRLYDGGFCQDISPELELNGGDGPDDRRALAELEAATVLPDAEARWAELQRLLDVDRVVTFLALEVLVGHWDGYGMNRNNYRLFHDLDAGRMLLLPHGLDQVFGRPHGRFGVDAPIDPEMRGGVARALLSIPAGRQLYRERLGDLATNRFDAAVLGRRAAELARRWRPTLAAYRPDWAEHHDALVRDLAEQIRLRFESVRAQLAAPAQVGEPAAKAVAAPDAAEVGAASEER